MLYEISDKNVWNALRMFDEAFDGLVLKTRKPTNKAPCLSECDFCKELPNNTWENSGSEKCEPPTWGGVKFANLMDDIEQVIFNDPATIVTFSDGSKVCVKACKNDKFSKETGLIYAIIKRLYANDTDENGYLKSKGLGEKISKVLEKAIDQKKLDEERKAKRAAKKAKKALAKNEEHTETKEIVPGQE